MTMIKHTDVCTLIKNEDDKDILTRRLFDVNMRLFDTSPGYRQVVLAACKYIKLLATTEREGYKKPHGFSGANAGIPFNIIALADGSVMINPRIMSNHDASIRTSLSNCGSLMLDEPIEVWRWSKITFGYYDWNGKWHEQTGYEPTVQHEIDHNKGILITDRKAAHA
jgi:hypothetical protein